MATNFVNALEVFINGKRIGIYVPPDGAAFFASVGNIPRKYWIWVVERHGVKTLRADWLLK
jgi:hypothetical protein